MKTYEKMLSSETRKDRTGIALNYNEKRWRELGIGAEESKLLAKTSKSIRKFLEEKDNGMKMENIEFQFDNDDIDILNEDMDERE